MPALVIKQIKRGLEIINTVSIVQKLIYKQYYSLNI